MYRLKGVNRERRDPTREPSSTPVRAQGREEGLAKAAVRGARKQYT